MGLITSPHDLLQLYPDWVSLEELNTVPDWVTVSLAQTPWVVVRRAPTLEHHLAVGVRGNERHLRQALTIPESLVARKVTPEQLVWSDTQLDQHIAEHQIDRERWHTMPALQALQQLSSRWESYKIIWGPGGSAGFELATGKTTLTTASDLDIVLRCPEPLHPTIAEQLWQHTLQLPVRVDVQIETPYGAVALSEWANPVTDRVLMRTLQGPLLVADPWNPRFRSIDPKR